MIMNLITEIDKGYQEQSLQSMLRIRANIRRSISSRKSVQEGKPDRIADLLEKAADRIDELEDKLGYLQHRMNKLDIDY